MGAEAINIHEINGELQARLNESLELLRPELRQDPFLVSILLETLLKEKRFGYQR